jgi:APA family basic amino acid/polyamine antiporter
LSSGRVFVRTATGLVRQMSTFDAVFYSWSAIGPFVMLIYFFPYGYAFFPGYSPVLASLIALPTVLLASLVYAGLGSAMPRSGGDYVFQSRILHPSVGFTVAMAFEVIYWMTVAGIAGQVFTQLGISPLFTLFGYTLASKALLELATTVATPMGLFVISAILLTSALINQTVGVKSFVNVQRYLLIPAILISTVTMAGILLSASPSSFQQSIDSWGATMVGDSNWYSTIMNSAKDAGYTTPPFSLSNTLIFMFLPMVSLAYCVFAAQGVLGEIKEANSLKNQFITYMSAGLFAGIQYVLLLGLLERVAGADFLNAAAVSFYNGLTSFPFTLTFTWPVLMLTRNPVLQVLVVAGFAANAYYWMAIIFMNCTRIMFAMSFDRILPQFISDVDAKYVTPMKANLVYWIITIVFIALFNFVTAFYWAFWIGVYLTAIIAVGITGVAALIFPKRRRDIYERSPIARYKLLGVPLLSIAAALLVVVVIISSYYMATVPAFGLNDLFAQEVILVILGCAFVWYVGYRWYQKSRGIDVDLAYKTIPPE